MMFILMDIQTNPIELNRHATSIVLENYIYFKRITIANILKGIGYCFFELIFELHLPRELPELDRHDEEYRE
jgi:hypothetical protein